MIWERADGEEEAKAKVIREERGKEHASVGGIKERGFGAGAAAAFGGAGGV